MLTFEISVAYTTSASAVGFPLTQDDFLHMAMFFTLHNTGGYIRW